ncbi:protein kinase domain-containing protein [Bremerella sp.]|uniref:protein kinase domain-containing protein n=1 Tax=Bremerella sp. TaxID=2795602 RepID=UPI00391A7809
MKQPETKSMGSMELPRAFQRDAICDEFESAWRQETPPDLSDYVHRVSEEEQAYLLRELIRVDLAYRVKKGEICSFVRYKEQFPRQADQIDELEQEFRQQSLEAVPAIGLFGHFELRECVGEGGFGTVWKAFDTRLERTVAIKLMRNCLAGERERNMFEREARSLARLKHPHIVSIHEFGEINGQLFLVSEFIEGETLKGVMASGLTPRRAAEITLSIVEAIHHVHSKGLVHRDLKPGNILFDRSGTPFLADFGLAKFLDSNSTIASDGDYLGTFAYMSPEQADGRASDVDPSSDVYSLGVVLYEMLTGKLPFAGKVADVLRQILNDDPVSPRRLNKEIPIDLETICLKCLAKEKRHRYASAEELQKELERFLRGEPIHANRVSKIVSMWRWTRRNAFVSSAMGTGIVASLIAIGAIFYAVNLAFSIPSEFTQSIVTTDPPGAKIAFVPLDPITREPLPEQMIHAPDTTPLKHALLPGNYLVVAYLDDGSGRFHEVYRHVPDLNKKGKGFGGPYKHLVSKDLKNGMIELPEIVIPNANISADMALLEGHEAFEVGSGQLQSIQSHHRVVPSFYMDTHEVTVAQYLNLSENRNTPASLRYKAVPEDWAIALDWDNAVARAEELGKRLPTEAEFEFAATWGGRQGFSWELACGAEELEQLFQQRDELGPVGVPKEDRVLTDPPIFGLCSNAAEWTSTSAMVDYSPLSGVGMKDFENHRVFRGGDYSVAGEGIATVSREVRNPRNRFIRDRREQPVGITFRGVRSVRPRLTPEDFEGRSPEESHPQ